MSQVAIRVQRIGKQYRIGEGLRTYRMLRDSLTNALTAPVRWMRSSNSRGRPRASETIWALKDVTFDVAPGQVVGLIGRNGAGKTTLLKVLSRITEPTTGSAEIHGRVGSLLEIGMGFHAELTGRENILLNGAILGMKRAEIRRNFDEIVAFAELEKFIDTPVKRYSTGMYMRLAFAVAAHLESEILLVDEVLAVGDVMFQKKCLGKIGDIAKGGRTVFFVSHNMEAVQDLCTWGICLRPGGVSAQGPIAAVIEAYLSTLTDGNLSNADLHSSSRSEGMGDGFRFLSVAFEGVEGGQIPLWSPLRLRLEFQATRKLSGISLGFSVFSMDRVCMFTCEAADSDSLFDLEAGGTGAAVAVVPNANLPPARYVVDIRARSGPTLLDSMDSAVGFEISPFGVAPWSSDRRYRPNSDWTYSVSDESVSKGDLQGRVR